MLASRVETKCFPCESAYTVLIGRMKFNVLINFIISISVAIGRSVKE